MGMTAKERAEYKPKCERCGELITDIDWLDASLLSQPDLAIPGIMRCSTEDCYDGTGSRVTSAIVPGGLTTDDRAWVNRHTALTREAT